MANGSAGPQLMLVGMGNPLLDLMAEVPPSFVESFGVSLGNAILAEEKHKSLYERMEKEFKVQRIPGGATLNTVRVCQALLQKKNMTGYAGCIGEDVRGQQMQQICTAEGVVNMFAKASLPTGVCAVMVTPGGERTMVTDLQSANEYKIECFKGHEEKRANAKIVFSAGFFISVCPELMLQSAKQFAQSNDQFYCLNLASPFFVSSFKDRFVEMFPYVDFLFSNKAEFLELAKVMNFGTEDCEEIVTKVAQLPKENQAKPRVVVMTRGCNSTIVGVSNWEGTGVKLSLYPVKQVDQKAIVDTNGAGDAFAGGFMAGLARGKSIDFCVNLGQLASRHIIQRSCCTFDFAADADIAKILPQLRE